METTTNVNFILKRPEEQQGDSGGGSNNNNQNNGNGSNNQTNGGGSNNQTNGGGSNNQTNGGSYNNQNTAGGTTSYGGSSYYYPTTDGSTIYTTDTSNVVVPNTGEHSPTESVGHSNHGLIPIFMILFLVIALAVVVRTIIKQKKSHRNFSGDNPKLGFTPLQISLVGSSTLALAFLGNSLLSSASIENQKSAEAATSLAISSLGTVEAKMEDHFDRKSLGYATEDIVKVTSTSSYGYHVFMQAETSNLYLNGNKESSDYFKPVSGSENGNLHDQDGSWGYHTVQGYADDKCHSAVSGELLDCERVNWLAAPTTATEIANIPAVDSGINSSSTEVYFGGNPSDDLKNGTYSTKITYTVVSDEPAPEPEPEPEPEPGPTPPTVEDCSATVHPTTTAGCKMADDREWILGDSNEGIAWNDAFTDATGVDNHDATLNSDICPAGYTAPSIADYDTLIQAYGGTPFATTAHLRDGYKETTGAVFNALGLSSGETYWSSTENDSSNAFVLFVDSSMSLSTGVGTKTTANKILCYKGSSTQTPTPTIAYMQDIDITTLPVGTTTTLVDARDNQEYTVYRWPTTGTAGTDYPTELAGAAIMTKDLSIGYVTGNTVVSGTDVVLTADSSAGEGTLIARTGASDWSNGNSITQYINGAGGGHSGHPYYSAHAAQKACPKGWRVPTSREFSKIGYNQSSSGAAIGDVPFNFVYGGYFSYSSNWVDIGNSGYYWTSDTFDNLNFSKMVVSPSGIESNSAFTSTAGLSVRCIASI